MKIYILTDLEGAAMVSRFVQTRDYKDCPDLNREAKQLLTAEVNAAVDGIFDACSDAEIIVLDGHGSGGIDLISFHPRAKLISVGPAKAPYGLDGSFDALFFVGQHAMAGTENAPLCHTYSSKSVEYFKINNQLVGEFGVRALMAGALGVPTVFISGDDKAIEEARALIPNIHSATVKWGLGLEQALHLSPHAARQLIREQAALAVRDIGNIKPLLMDPPYLQEIRVKPGANVDGFLRPLSTRIDERTAFIRSGNLLDLFL